MRSYSLCTLLLCLVALPATEICFAGSPSEGNRERNAGGGAAGVAGNALERAGIDRGLCAVVGCDDGELLVALAKQSRLLFHAIDTDDAAVASARKAVDGAGLYGTRVVVERWNGKALPYADNTVDVLIVPQLTEPAMRELPLPEILRVLRPKGKALLWQAGAGRPPSGSPGSGQLGKWLDVAGAEAANVSTGPDGLRVELTKAPPKGTDEWTHWQHGPDNNPLSSDAVIKAPYLTQWTGEPYYIAMPAITTVAGGRTFCAMGHIAHHEREEPWLNTLVGRNGYNGIELWRLKLPSGYLVHRSAFIAKDNAFYMIDGSGSGCAILHPETGRQIGEIRVPEISGEWKWIAMEGDVLYLLAGERDLREVRRVRSDRSHWSWEELSNGYYRREIPWGFGRTLAAYDLKQKKLLWQHDEQGLVDSRAMVLGDGRLYFYGPYSHVGCLDARTGDVRWTNRDPKVRELIQEEGRGLSSTPGFRTEPMTLVTQDALCFAPQTNENVVAVSTQDGRLLWQRRKSTSNPNLLYADGRVLVGVGEKGSTLALDPLTGKEAANLGFWKRSCARLTGCPDAFFCRGQPEGVTRYDRQTKKIAFNGAMRPSCNDGVIPANGLLYIGPWLCDCNLSLMGAMALCSAGDFRFDRSASEAGRIERGPDTPSASALARFDLSSKDWPVYRADNAHSASSQARLATTLAKCWAFDPGAELTPTAPTAAGGLVFLGGDDGKVRALDAETGEPRWCFLTAGPICVPPTIWEGRAYVGSGDGYVYCLEAATGRLLWRFRAAPVERRIMIYEHLCSNWPVNTGVLVQNGVAYVGAGLIDTDGTYVYALDARTGELKWENNSSGHLNREIRKGISAHGRLAIADGKLWMAGGNVVSPARYDLGSGKCLNENTVEGPPQTNRGEEVCVFNNRFILTGGRLMFSAFENVVDPGYFELIKANEPDSAARLIPGKIPPAWDDRTFVYVNGRRGNLRCCDAGELEKNLGQRRDLEPAIQKRWVANIPKVLDTVSLAVARNAIVAVCQTVGEAGPTPERRAPGRPAPAGAITDRPRAKGQAAPGRPLAQRAAAQQGEATGWAVLTLDPKTGKVIWQDALPSRPLSGGLLVDREGRILVILENGKGICFGSRKGRPLLAEAAAASPRS